MHNYNFSTLLIISQQIYLEHGKSISKDIPGIRVPCLKHLFFKIINWFYTLKSIVIFCACWLYLQVCVFTSCMPRSLSHQKRILDLYSLKLKLQVIIRHHVSTGNQAQVLWNSIECSFFFLSEYQHNYI